MFINWVEVGSDGSATQGTVHFYPHPPLSDGTGNCTLPQPIFGAALMPPQNLNVMQTEINRLYVSTKEGNVIPLSVSVPRRQYLDFHSDLYPLVFDHRLCSSAGMTRVDFLQSRPDRFKNGWKAVRESAAQCR
jgi:hypothetical protein